MKGKRTVCDAAGQAGTGLIRKENVLSGRAQFILNVLSRLTCLTNLTNSRSRDTNEFLVLFIYKSVHDVLQLNTSVKIKSENLYLLTNIFHTIFH